MEMYCAYCGAKLEDTDTFCGVCGQPNDGGDPFGQSGDGGGFLEESPPEQGSKTPFIVAGVLGLVLLVATALLLVFFRVIDLPWGDKSSEVVSADSGSRGVTRATAAPAQSPSSRAIVPEETEPAADTWRIAVNTSNRPYAFLSGGEPDGFDVELVRRLAEDMGLSCEFVYTENSRLGTALKDGTADVAVAATEAAGLDSGTACVVVPCCEVYEDGGAQVHSIYLPTGSEDLSEVSVLIGKYNSSGWFDTLREKWGLALVASEYILPESDSRYLTAADLEGLSQRECCLARNEIYARRHRLFTHPELAAYFSAQSWYSGTISGDRFDAGVFNEYERSNVFFIKQYETDVWGGSYY